MSKLLEKSVQWASKLLAFSLLFHIYNFEATVHLRFVYMRNFATDNSTETNLESWS